MVKTEKEKRQEKFDNALMLLHGADGYFRKAKKIFGELGIDVNVTYPIETYKGIPTVFLSSGTERISDIFEEEIEESVPFFTEKGNKDYRNVSARGIMFYEPKRGRKNAKAV